MNYMILYCLNVFQTVLRLLFPILMAVIAVGAGIFCVVWSVRLIKRQIKLYNSITLVELRRNKLHYWAFVALLGFIMLYIILQMFDKRAPEVVLLKEVFLMQRWEVNVILGLVVLLIVCSEFLLVTLALSRIAVVDKGVYTGFFFLDWYHVHDYIIDEERAIVTLTSSPHTFATLSGTTPPFKIAKNDVAKLKFILNKNKNKFSGFNKN